MTRVVITILSTILLICILPMSASAQEAFKAPTVQYKLINHDEIALRWSSVEGADGYYIYRKDVATGKTARTTKLIKDTSYNVTGLTPSTEYIFKVAAVSENEGYINIGEKSKGTMLTTPDKWYYYFESDKDSYFDPYSDDINKAVMKRRHYDNSGIEDFDMTHINTIARNIAIDDQCDSYLEYHKYDFTYVNGYVYFDFEYATSSEDYILYICRMKNDGSDFEIVESTWANVKYKICVDWENNNEYIYATNNHNYGLWDLEDEDYEIIKNFNYFNEDLDDIYDDLLEYQKNTGFDIWSLYEHVDSCESNIIIFYYDKDKKINEKELYSEERTALSEPVGDEKYIYFFSEPLYGITDKIDTVIYRAKYDGSGLQKIITLPLIYGSTELYDCDGEYLYYYVYERKANEGNMRDYYTFYRININEEKAVPQKIISVDSMYDFELCNGYLYIETGISDVNNNWIPIYVRIGANGKGLRKQDKPFEWRY